MCYLPIPIIWIEIVTRDCDHWKIEHNLLVHMFKYRMEILHSGFLNYLIEIDW